MSYPESPTCDPTDNDYSGCHSTPDLSNYQPPNYSPNDDGYSVESGGDDLDTYSEGLDRIERTGGF